MRINKADIILAVVIAIVGIASSFYIGLHDGDLKDGIVTIYKNNKIHAKYALNEDREITIDEKGHINKITIKEGVVQMSFANCHSQDCVKQGKITDGSKTIVCLPHKVVIEIEKSQSGYDSVSK